MLMLYGRVAGRDEQGAVRARQWSGGVLSTFELVAQAPRRRLPALI